MIRMIYDIYVRACVCAYVRVCVYVCEEVRKESAGYVGTHRRWEGESASLGSMIEGEEFVLFLCHPFSL